MRTYPEPRFGGAKDLKRGGVKMAKASLQNRRRKYFIKKEFQTKFILKFCIPIVLTALISAFVIYHYSSQSTTTVFEDSRLILKPTAEFIKPGLVLSTLVSIVIVGIATIIVMFFVSHRIAGPLYKLESSLKSLGNGDLSFDIYFRRKDEIKRLADVFNTASKDLNRLIKDVKIESTHLDSAIKELKTLLEKLPEEQQGKLKEAIEKLEAENNRINEKLNRFRLR